VTNSGTVDRDGFKLDWVREGRGIPMMVLGARRFYPRYFPQSLREHFEMVFCDLRQWVPTPDGFDVTTITLDTFSEDVDAVRKAVGFERPIVAGQSQHGTIALEYARHSPESVRGVVAIVPSPPAGSGDGLESPDDFFQRDADADRLAAHERYQAQRPGSVETAQDFVDDYLADSAMVWYDYTVDTSSLWDGTEVNLEVMDRLFEPDTLGGFQIDALDVPVFLALGRYDYAFPFYLWDEPKKRFSNLRYKMYDKSAHQPPYEQPDEFTADVVEWANTLWAQARRAVSTTPTASPKRAARPTARSRHESAR
jgi:proline iminopeptidase